MNRTITDRWASLCRISQLINSSLVLDEVLNLVLDNLIELTGAERAAIMLFDSNGDLVVRAARTSDRAALPPDFFKTSRNVIRDVAVSGAPRVVNDALTETGYQDYGSVIIHGLRSILCAPLKARGEIRGVLYVDNRLLTAAFTVDDLDILTAFADQSAVAIENANLYQELGRQERMRREMEIARSIQAQLMPRHLPQPPGFELAAACVPALDVGGDFYDAFTVPDGRVFLFLGDVSGKGVPAALLMGMVRTLLRSEVQHSQSLVDVVRQCNHILYEDFSNTSMFATLLLGMLDPHQRTFTYLNCGHCEPLLLRGPSDQMELLAGDGLPLGILDDFETTERVIHFDEGDVLVIYSDGFSEAKGPAGDFFGVERLHQATRASIHGRAEAILDDIGTAIDQFVQTEPQSDDQTIMVLRATV